MLNLETFLPSNLHIKLIRNHLHLKVADEKMKCSSVFDSLFVCGCLCDYTCPGAGAVTMAPRTLKLGIGTLLNIL